MIVALLPVIGVFGTALWNGYTRLGKIESAVRVLAAQQSSQQKDLIRDLLSGAKITITEIPPAAAGGPDLVVPIGGFVRDVDVNRIKVVVYALADKWYIQPSVHNPYATIAPDGHWKAETHLASAYAAVLVEASFKPPLVMDALPSASGPILDIASAPGRWPKKPKP